jgi:hypothetical protein
MSMMNIQKGNPYTATITITNSNGTPYDLTGKTVFFTIKRINDNTVDITDATALIKATTTHTVPHTSGITTLTLTDIQTAISVGEYKADIRIYNGLGVKLNSESFIASVKDIVTRRIA